MIHNKYDTKDISKRSPFVASRLEETDIHTSRSYFVYRSAYLTVINYCRIDPKKMFMNVTGY